MEDDSIAFITPFPNRETEWQYIVDQIAQILQKDGGNDIQKLKTILKNNIVVSMVHREHKELFIPLFREVGLFIFNNDVSLEILTLKGRVLKTFSDVYFKRVDFLSENILYENGEPLTYSEKLKVFVECFDGITIKTSQSPMGAGRCQPLAEGKGVHREVESEGSLMQSSAPRNTNNIRHVSGVSLLYKTKPNKRHGREMCNTKLQSKRN